MDIKLYAYFLCFAIPLTFMLSLMDKKARLLIVFVIIGGIQFLFSQNVSEVLLSTFPSLGNEYIMTTFVPIVFELSKAFPIVFYIFIADVDAKSALGFSTAIGTGFAIMESINLMPSLTEDNVLTIFFMIIIYIIINIVCTCLIGIVITYAIKNVRYFLYSILALIFAAATLHGTVNLFVEAHMYLAGALICVIIFIPIVIILSKRKKRQRILTRLNF